MMNYVAGDIFNLGCASRAAYFDCRNVLYGMSICSPQQQETVLAYARLLDPVAAGLTDVYIESSLTLVHDSSAVAKSNSKSEQKLADLEKLFRVFYDVHKPETVFSEVAANISGVTGKYSIISPSVVAEMGNVNSWLVIVQNLFREERLSNFESKPVADKQEIDEYIIKEALFQYQDMFDEPEIPI